MSNKGHRTFRSLYLINGALYDQSLYETHNSKSYKWPFSLPYKI